MVQYMESTPGERSLNELYEACARDDTNAIAEFVRLYQPELAGYARRHNADDPEGAADLATFDTVRRLADMRSLEESAIRAYLYRCLKSRMIDENRRSHLHQVSLDDLPDELATDGPEAPVLDQLGLDEMLDLLTPAEREVVSHRFVAGYTSVETAERVGRSPDAVRRLQSNALARLRLALAVAVVVAVLGAAAWFVATSPATRNTEPIGDPADQSEPDEDSMPPNRADERNAGATGLSPTTPAAASSPRSLSASDDEAAAGDEGEPGAGPNGDDAAAEADAAADVDGTEGAAATGGPLPAIGSNGVPQNPADPPVTRPNTNGQPVITRAPARSTTITTTEPSTTVTPETTTTPDTTTTPETTEPPETTAGPATTGLDGPSTSSASTITSTPGTTTSTSIPSSTTTTEPGTNPGQEQGRGRGPGPGGPPTDDGRAGPDGRPPGNDPAPNQPPGQGNGPGPNNRPGGAS